MIDSMTFLKSPASPLFSLRLQSLQSMEKHILKNLPSFTCYPSHLNDELSSTLFPQTQSFQLIILWFLSDKEAKVVINSEKEKKKESFWSWTIRTEGILDLVLFIFFLEGKMDLGLALIIFGLHRLRKKGGEKTIDESLVSSPHLWHSSGSADKSG